MITMKHIIKLSDGNTLTDPRYGSVIAMDISDAVPLEKLDLAYASVRPDASSPAHFHRATEEIYAITHGEGVMTIDGVSTPVKPGDVVRIPTFAVHSIRAGSEGLRFIVVTSPPYTEGDDVETDDFNVDTAERVGRGPDSRPTIAIVAGTTRIGSMSRKVSRQICGMYDALGIATDFIDLAELPLELFTPAAFERRYETDAPLAQRFSRADGLHLVVPEYSGSFPGILKHVLDVQPYKECFDGKPVAFVGVAAGDWGGLRAVEQLQQVFGYRNAFIFPRRVFIKNVDELEFDNAGNLIDPEIVGRMKEQVDGFVGFVGCLKALR